MLVGGCTRARQADHGEPSDPDGFMLASWSGVPRRSASAGGSRPALALRRSRRRDGIASPALSPSSMLACPPLAERLQMLRYRKSMIVYRHPGHFLPERSFVHSVPSPLRPCR